MESYRIENLTFTYLSKSEPTLHGLNLTIKAGRFVTLCGPSGCGKTTLLRRLKPTFAPHGEVSGKINRELGVTVIMTEYRLEEVFPLSDRVIVMDAGRVIADGTPTEIGMSAFALSRHCAGWVG